MAYLLGSTDESIAVDLNQRCIKACPRRIKANDKENTSLVVSNGVEMKSSFIGTSAAAKMTLRKLVLLYLLPMP
jgi:hypothetical protein